MNKPLTLEEKCAKAGGNSARLGMNYHRYCPFEGECQYKSPQAYTTDPHGELFPCCRLRYKK